MSIEMDNQVFETVEEMSAYLDEQWKKKPLTYKARIIAKRKLDALDNLRRQPRFMWQRARRGYSEQDTWSFDGYLASVIVGGVTDLRERRIGYPSGLTPEKWDEILGKIIDGFTVIQQDDPLSPEQQAVFDEAVALFGRWFQALWD